MVYSRSLLSRPGTNKFTELAHLRKEVLVSAILVRKSLEQLEILVNVGKLLR